MILSTASCEMRGQVRVSEWRGVLAMKIIDAGIRVTMWVLVIIVLTNEVSVAE